MSKLGDLFVLAQQVSIAAKEEASRYDLPQVDVDHLLLALLVGGGPAGELLRAQGVTLGAARRATEQVRADHIARLGIVPPAAAPGPIRNPAIGDMEWTPRALKVVSSLGDPDDLALLVGLLEEPSGLVVDVLSMAGVDVAALRAAVAGPRATAGTSPPSSFSAGWREVTHTGFVPAPVADVWALLTDPERRRVWDAAAGTVEVVEPDLWEVRPAPVRPDGRPVRRHPGYGRTHHRRTAYEPETRIEWEVTLPDRPRSGRYRLAVRLRTAPGGTVVDLAMRWPRRSGWGALRQSLLYPAHRVVATQSLLEHAAGLSRALR